MRYSSVPSGKVVQPPEAKGITAEVWEGCPVVPRWAVREHLPDCHKIFVKRYQWLFGTRYFAMPHSHEPLDKAVHFLFPHREGIPGIEMRG